jgi:hypothetical protein
MALTDLQRDILRVLAGNRSETSYMAGGASLNRDWPRLSDDFDIFHDTDEEIGASAERDIASLVAAGFGVSVDITIYGLVEATVSRGGARTVLQWMSESRTRFLPLVRDAEWGARLHQADLAVNKAIAAASRSKARDFADLLAIETHYCRLAPLALAAAGKPPYFAPTRMLEEMARRLNGLTREELRDVRGLPSDWTPDVVRQRLAQAIEAAGLEVLKAVEANVGRLALDPAGVPGCVPEGTLSAGWTLRRATEEQDAMPEFKDGPSRFLG